MTRVERRHGVFAAIFTLSVAAASLVGSLAPHVELVLVVTMITLFGLPHGALDYISGRALLQPSLGRWWFLPFGVGYLALAGLVVVAWLVAPVASLIAFLLVSAAHFGAGDVHAELALGADRRFSSYGKALEAMGRGSLILIPLLHFHPEAASELFAHVIPVAQRDVYGAISAATPHLFALGGATLAVITAHHLGGWAEGKPRHGRVALEIVSLAALFAVAQPLIAFVVYFCIWHSFRHSLRQAAELDPSGPVAALRAFVGHAWPTTAAAFLLGAGAYTLVEAPSTEAATIQVVFIGLSALTAPHIVLGWLSSSTNPE